MTRTRRPPPPGTFICLLGLLLISCNSNGMVDGSQEQGRNPSDFTPRAIVINEVMVLQDSTIADPDFGEHGSWIELRNREDDEVDLGGWIVAARGLDAHPEQSDTIPEGTTIAAGGLLLVWADGRDTAGEAFHTRFRLSVEGGRVGLYGPAWAGTPVIDTLSYGALDVAPDISLGRMSFGEEVHAGFLLPMSRPTPGEENSLETLRLLDSFPLGIGDPSGLAPDRDGNSFWIVSDNPGGSIYRITDSGQIVEELPVEGDDMEGIAQHPETGALWVVEERRREILTFDTDGSELARFGVDVEVTNENDGLEGIAIDPVTDHVFVVNKRLPRVLIELDVARGPESQQIRNTPVNFGAAADAPGLSLAGLHFDVENRLLWLVSDEARAVFVLDRTGRPLAAFDAGREDLEAIALLRERNRIYLVSDGLRTLFAFEFPGPLRKLPADGD